MLLMASKLRNTNGGSSGFESNNGTLKTADDDVRVTDLSRSSESS